MGEWATKYPIDFSPTGDTTSQAIEKHINELKEIYNLLNRVRKLDAGPDAPIDPIVGHIWLDTSGGQHRLKMWDGAQWVEILAGGTGDTGDTVGTGDTGDTEGTGDTGDTEGTGDTGETEVTPSTLDIFGDGSCIALFEFEGNLHDTGGVYNAVMGLRGYEFVNGVIGQAIAFPHLSVISQAIKIFDLPFNSFTEVVTVSAWIKWLKNSPVTLFGWDWYIITFWEGFMGFSAHGGLYGIPSSEFEYTWKHVVVEFRAYQYGKIWVDGVLRDLELIREGFNVDYAYMGSVFWIFGSGWASAFGAIDHLRIFNRALTDEEVQILYNEGGQS